ncbi:MAG: Mut7-C RNAse domain-containing protein [candidate division WOR-3 bacterium]
MCDFMLGRLAKWMRLMGFDTTYYRDTDGKTIIYRSRKEGRTILTRSKILAEKYDDLILIESEHLIEQLRQLTKIVDVRTPFSRCPVCNTETEKVKKENVKEDVPPYIFEIHNNFKRCPKCGRIFWKGTHYKDIEKVIDEIKN